MSDHDAAVNRVAGPITSPDEADQVRARLQAQHSLPEAEQTPMILDLIAEDEERLRVWEEAQIDV